MLMMLIYWAEGYTIKKNAEALVAASEEIGLEVNAHKVHDCVSRSERRTNPQCED